MVSLGSTKPSPANARLCLDSNSGRWPLPVSSISYQMCHQLVINHSATLNRGTTTSSV